MVGRRLFSFLALAVLGAPAAQAAAGDAAACLTQVGARYNSCLARCRGSNTCRQNCFRARLASRARCPGSPSAAEQRVVDLVNQERRNQNLPALVVDGRLGEAAQLHSAKQAATGNSSHVIEGKDPAARATASRYPFRSLYENIYWGQGAAKITPEAAMTWWMNSSGHRANILSRDVEDIGVGIRAGSGGKTYFTIKFGRR